MGVEAHNETGRSRLEKEKSLLQKAAAFVTPASTDEHRYQPRQRQTNLEAKLQRFWVGDEDIAWLTKTTIKSSG